MYRVTVESEDTYLLVMRNMFSHRLHVHRKYDLKVNPAGGVCGRMRIHSLSLVKKQTQGFLKGREGVLEHLEPLS